MISVDPDRQEPVAMASVLHLVVNPIREGTHTKHIRTFRHRRCDRTHVAVRQTPQQAEQDLDHRTHTFHLHLLHDHSRRLARTKNQGKEQTCSKPGRLCMAGSHQNARHNNLSLKHIRKDQPPEIRDNMVNEMTPVRDHHAHPAMTTPKNQHMNRQRLFDLTWAVIPVKGLHRSVVGLIHQLLVEMSEQLLGVGTMLAICDQTTTAVRI